MVVPPLPALLADATGQLLRDLGPLLGSDAAYEFYDGLILLQNVGKQHGSWMRTLRTFPQPAQVVQRGETIANDQTQQW
jgi:hypothetical protein